MAEYKVPQDVEADDKLIGPFSFRQFIYLIVVALSVAAGWGLSQLFLPLAIIPLPLIVFFGALALPLRKDQPMEIFLAAMVSFYLKPRRRIWDPDGLESLIEITVPKTIEVVRSKNISQAEAQQRFSYLADVVDSQGWAVRGVQAPNTAMNSDVYFEAQQTQDVLDSDSTISQNLDYKLEQSDSRRYQETLDRVRQQAAAVAIAPAMSSPSGSYNYFGESTDSTDNTAVSDTLVTSDAPEFNPYPDEIKQTVIQPVSDNPNPVSASMPTPPTPTPVTTSEKTPSADIMNLATNTDLSIQTIAHEANRLQNKANLNEEVVISLR